MSRNHDDYETYETYETLFDPMQNDRKARRKRKTKAHHVSKKSADAIIQESAEDTTIEGGLKTTYKPSLHEAGWLLDSLRQFFDQAYISDILAVVKGGKEASVYRCEAEPTTGHMYLAAKVYRPRMFRQLRNDRMYREGREILTEEGRAVKKTDARTMRALGKKTSYGAQVAHTSWLMYEFNTLKLLYAAGAAVPQPFSAGENAILMTYLGSAEMAAPTLSEIDLERDEVEPLYDEVMRNIALMLDHGIVHGDLSAYNILYWQGDICLIDFPQVTYISTNPHAGQILERDIVRVCEYFNDQGLDVDANAVYQDFYERYLEPDPQQRAAELSRLTEAQHDDD